MAGSWKRRPTSATHCKQLADELARSREASRDLTRFIESFVRPRGIDKPVIPFRGRSPQLRLPGSNRSPRRSPGRACLRRSFWRRSPRLPLCRAKVAEAVLNFSTRVFRFGLFNIARIREVDATSLVARRTPLDYPKNPISILVTSPKENSSRARSVMSEPWTVHWLERVVSPGEVLYDVGANVGTYSLVAAISHDREVRVFAFEPSFVTYAALCRNILENDCDRVHHADAGRAYRAQGNTVFKYRSLVSGAIEHAVGGRSLYTKGFKERKPVYQQRILGIPLDSLIADFQLDPTRSYQARRRWR